LQVRQFFEVPFSNANLRNSIFKGIVLIQTNFRGADLSGSSFEEYFFKSGSIDKTFFEDVDLSESIAGNTLLRKCEFCNTKLPNGEIIGAGERLMDREDRIFF
jgi:uncharacterized protein YjbI with pentapeptide repeats